MIKTVNKFMMFVLLITAAVFLPVCTTYAEDDKPILEPIKVISTTEQALSFTFSYIENKDLTMKVLDKLDELNVKGTFFVSEEEMKKYPDIVKEIASRGHEIGVSTVNRASDTYERKLAEMNRSFNLLQKNFGTSTKLVKQIRGVIPEFSQQAIKDSGGVLIGQSINLMQAKHQAIDDTDLMVRELFGRYKFSFGRGEIIFFQLDFYANKEIIIELIDKVKRTRVDSIAYSTPFDNPEINPQNDSAYAVKPVGVVMANEKYLWEFPVDPKNYIPYLQKDGNYIGVTEDTVVSEGSKRYIGAPTVNKNNRMYGFSKPDMRKLDYKGKIRTDENVVFLTFDDWGTDAAVNKLLYVFRKHNLKGTFYVITNRVVPNQNLLRAIALEGHEIGSHSHEHRPMSIMGKKGLYAPTQTYEEMLEDYSTSFKFLRSVVGDIEVDGRPALYRTFRPPTMAVSKKGFEALFRSGFEKI